MKYILIRWAITAVALVVTVYLVPGIEVTGNGLIAVLGMAVVLGFANAIIRPLLTLLSCGLVLVTLGLFMLVVNALTLWAASWLAQLIGLGFVVNGFWPAFWGSIIISIISFVLSLFVKGDHELG